jgi:hypothetical protein
MPELIRDRSPRFYDRGKRPDERSIEELLDGGVINLDKVQGPTSHQVTAWVKDILGVKKIGHGGTLDPHVSGVLPIALGRATRLTDLVLRSDKEYVCHMKLHRDRPKAKVTEILATFVGAIYQTPPVRSAVKRQMRMRRVQSINILEIKGRDVLFRVSCDAGTYIRTLCVDVGEALGCGANMVSLRRSGSWLSSSLRSVRPASSIRRKSRCCRSSVGRSSRPAASRSARSRASARPIPPRPPVIRYTPRLFSGLEAGSAGGSGLRSKRRSQRRFARIATTTS